MIPFGNISHDAWQKDDRSDNDAIGFYKNAQQLYFRKIPFLASQDALEVIVSLSEWVSQSVTLRTELTDVTLVSEDTYWELYWQDSGN